MKKLELVLSSCADCPFVELYSDWLCTHEDGRGKIIDGKLEVGNGFPDWCPIQDEEPGVKVGLTVMIIRDGKILLGKRINTETALNKWAYPGGRMDYGEDPINGVMREVLEETGLKLNIEKLRFLDFKNEPFPDENKHYVSLVFTCTDFDGEPEVKEPEKCEKWDWYDPFNLPENTFWAIKETIAKNKNVIEAIIIESEREETLKQLKAKENL